MSSTPQDQYLAVCKELERLNHDIARHVQIAADQAQEIEALRHDLAAARAERKEIWWLPWEPQEVARRFHLAYEHFAPDFGYETRPDTKVFDPYSANGQLMIAVVRNVLIEQASSKGVDELNATRADLAAAQRAYEITRQDCWNLTEKVIPNIRQDLAAARALNEAMIANLPGPYYMDPPDGGSVNPEEQMRRLAKDAERYRWIKKQSIKMATAKDDFSCYDADYTVSILFRKRPPSLNGYILAAPQGNELDAAIDAALDKQRSGE